MKSALKWGSLCLFVYIIFLIVYLPATQVLSRLTLPSNISLSGVSGTIWNGQAQSVQANGLPVEQVKWSLSFLPLLLGEVSADIKAGNIRDSEQISFNGHIVASGNTIQAKDLVAYLPTHFVISKLPLPMPVNAGGRFKIQLNGMEYTDSCQVLDGSGQWLKATFTGANKVIDLGNFDAALACQNGNILMNVKEPNSFGLTAIATIPANMKFSIEGRFKPAASLPKEVHQAAQFFGQPGADGYFPLKF